jgi:hypothetical protein
VKASPTFYKGRLDYTFNYALTHPLAQLITFNAPHLIFFKTHAIAPPFLQHFKTKHPYYVTHFISHKTMQNTQNSQNLKTDTPRWEF